MPGVATLGTIVTIDGDAIYGVQDIAGPGLTTDTDEITNHSSPNNTEEFIATIKRTGDYSFPLVVDPTDTGMAALFAAWEDREPHDFVVTDPAGTTHTFSGYVVSFAMSMPVAGHLSADVTIKPAAAPAIVFPS